MKTLWIGVDPRPDRTRILAMSGPETVVLKAHLSPRPSSRLALSALSEALCLWEGQPGRVALVATHLASCSQHAPFAEEPSLQVVEAWSRYQVDALRPAGGLAPGAQWKKVHNLVVDGGWTAW